MRTFIFCLITLLFFLPKLQAQTNQKNIPLFDGKTFNGWEGDTTVWHIVNGSLVGGNLTKTLPHNEFLATKESFGDFELNLEFKLTGTGFVNAGVQFHSQRLQNPPYEMQGYQADLGDDYWASLYDESRRDVTIVKPDNSVIKKILIPNSWNSFSIKSVGRRIIIKLNGIQTVDYTEPDKTISHTGHIALQVHGGGKVEASYRKIKLTQL